MSDRSSEVVMTPSLMNHPIRARIVPEGRLTVSDSSRTLRRFSLKTVGIRKMRSTLRILVALAAAT
jgi:hypothetical protein